MDNEKNRTDYKSIIYGMVVILLVGVILGVFQSRVDSPTIKNLAFIVAVAIALGCHFYIYSKGGWLPRNGKPTIHSKIILFSIVFAVTFLSLFWITIYYRFIKH